MNVATILNAKGKAVATARPDASLLDVAAKLAARKIGAIVVVGDNGRVAGIISERDIVRAIAAHGSAALAMTAAEFMTRDIVSCRENTTVEDLMATMTDGRFRHMPVIEDGALVGIVSIGDVVKNHIAEVEMEVTAMRGYLATG